MVRWSNCIIGFLNFVTLTLATATVVYASHLYVKKETACERWLRFPLVSIGGAVMALSLAGLLGSWCRMSAFMWLYLFLLFWVIMGLMVMTVFAAMATHRGMVELIGDHVIQDYPNWLQSFVLDDKRWDNIRTCLVHAHFCGTIPPGMGREYYRHRLSRLQSGCCKPPNYCEMEFKNGTTWMMPKTGPASSDPDCITWSNDQSVLCYKCQSCRREAITSIRQEWRMFALANACFTLFLSIVYSVGSCALRNNQSSYIKHGNVVYHGVASSSS